MELWQPLQKAKLLQERKLDFLPVPESVWLNNIYQVLQYPVNDEGIIWLSIKRIDKEPCNNWRHFQYIKNQLVGPENEAIQIYPAESRLVDGSNQYHLWVFADSDIIMPTGFFQRIVSERPMQNGKQRAWEKNMRPKDIKEQTKAVLNLMKENQLK